MFKPFSRLTDHDGGFEVEACLGLDGPSVAVSKTLHAPAWLQIWCIGQTERTTLLVVGGGERSSNSERADIEGSATTGTIGSGRVNVNRTAAAIRTAIRGPDSDLINDLLQNGHIQSPRHSRGRIRVRLAGYCYIGTATKRPRNSRKLPQSAFNTAHATETLHEIIDMR